MQSRESVALVYVSHPVAGVHRVPEDWLDGYGPSGFRLATAEEIRGWCDERGIEPPAEAEPPDPDREPPPVRSTD